MDTVRTFDYGICGAVSTVENPANHLVVGENGILADVPVNVKGFHVFVGLPKGLRAFVAQKNVDKELGGYSTEKLAGLGRSNGVQWIAMRNPVKVQRAGKNVWTVWHTDTPNRLDIWMLDRDGSLALYQLGVITHDDGKTWRLHGEYRWRGKLFIKDGKPVAQPEGPRVKWGPFVTWQTIFEHPNFRVLLADAKLQEWAGKPTDLEPPLPHIPPGNYAVVQWFVPFAGQTGQGYVWTTNGGLDPACIHGVDLRVPADADGVKRLYRGDIVTYSKTGTFGNKQSLKLLNVRLAMRSW